MRGSGLVCLGAPSRAMRCQVVVLWEGLDVFDFETSVLSRFFGSLVPDPDPLPPDVQPF